MIWTDIPQFELDGAGRKRATFPCGSTRVLRVANVAADGVTAVTLAGQDYAFALRNAAGALLVSQTTAGGGITLENSDAGDGVDDDRADITFVVPSVAGKLSWALWDTTDPDNAIAGGTLATTAVAAQP